MIWVALVFYACLVIASYRIGANNAAYGVALFLVGVVAFQLFTHGPSSFLDTSCEYYGSQARDC